MSSLDGSHNHSVRNQKCGPAKLMCNPNWNITCRNFIYYVRSIFHTLSHFSHFYDLRIRRKRSRKRSNQPCQPAKDSTKAPYCTTNLTPCNPLAKTKKKKNAPETQQNGHLVVNRREKRPTSAIPRTRTSATEKAVEYCPPVLIISWPIQLNPGNEARRDKN